MKRAFSTCLVFSLAAFFLLTFSSSIFAAEPIYAAKEPVVVHNPFYAGIFGGWVIPEDLKMGNPDSVPEVHLDQSWIAGAKVGYIFPFKWLAAELEGAYVDKLNVDNPGTGDFKNSNLMANLVLRYPEGMIRPYIGAGAGWSWSKFDGSYKTATGTETLSKSANDFAWQALAGINLEILPNLSIDFGYRFFNSKYKFENIDATAKEHIILCGLNYHFGAKKAAPAAPAPEPVMEQVKPQAEAAPVVEEVKPQAEAAPVVEDKSQTRVAQEIEEKGRTTLNVLFDFDKATIRKNSSKDIDNLGDVMKKYKDLNINIEGHTDSIGSDAYNEKLSQKRADAVKKYLVEKSGIDAKRLSAKGFGEKKPIASNKNKEGRQKNRRVEAVADYIIKK